MCIPPRLKDGPALGRFGADVAVAIVDGGIFKFEAFACGFGCVPKLAVVVTECADRCRLLEPVVDGGGVAIVLPRRPGRTTRQTRHQQNHPKPQSHGLSI